MNKGRFTLYMFLILIGYFIGAFVIQLINEYFFYDPNLGSGAIGQLWNPNFQDSLVWLVYTIIFLIGSKGLIEKLITQRADNLKLNPTRYIKNFKFFLFVPFMIIALYLHVINTYVQETYIGLIYAIKHNISDRLVILTNTKIPFGQFYYGNVQDINSAIILIIVLVLLFTFVYKSKKIFLSKDLN